MKILSNKWIDLAIILIFSILGMKALFHPGLFTAHDIWHQVVRLYYYSQGVNDGQFPPYWIGQLAKGFGYPLFFFSYHLPWILGLPFLKIGLDISITLKILFFLAYLLSGLFMYLLIHNLLKNRLAALLSAVIYLWSPYHFLTIFVGASIGIVFVFTFLPLLLLGIHLVREGQKLGIPVIALGLAGIILSHLQHLVFLAPTISIFTLWELISAQKRIGFIQKMFLGVALGILLSAFYLIPAVYYNQFTKIHQEGGFSDLYQRNFINFNQLIYSKWGYGPIVTNAKDGEISFQLGIAQWFSIIAVIILLFLGKLSKNYILLSVFILIDFVISIFMMLNSSLPIWKLLEKFIALDYPFRQLLSATFVGSISAGILLVNFKRKLQSIIFVLIILIALYTNRNHTKVNLYTDIPLATYLASEITTNSFNEYLPIQADTKLLDRPWNEAIGENLSISNIKQTTNLLSFDLNLEKKEQVSIGQFYFPGQTLYLDNKISKFSIDKEGRINLTASPGIHTVTVKYQETLLIKVSKFLTAIGILIVLFLFLKQKDYSFFRNAKLFRKQCTSNPS